MKKIILAITTLLFCQIVFSQTKTDYIEYIKSHGMISYAYNVSIKLSFGYDISKFDANKFTGRSITDEEYKNLFVSDQTIYTEDKTPKVYTEIVSCFDLRGIRKVSTVKTQNDEGVYYSILIYINNGYICNSWISLNNSLKSDSKQEITIKADETIANNVKKAFIELAKLCGAVNVIDGDNLFRN
jgi:hypothetical protein